MPSKPVRVELGDNGLPVRIFRDGSWRDLPVEKVKILTKQQAVGSIREQVFERALNLDTEVHECEKCGRRITWDGFHMNEKELKSLGGQVSLENCEALCGDCHVWGPDAYHGNRRWQTAKMGAR